LSPRPLGAAAARLATRDERVSLEVLVEAVEKGLSMLKKKNKIKDDG
jgi:hypothetical protein